MSVIEKKVWAGCEIRVQIGEVILHLFGEVRLSRRGSGREWV